MNSFADVIAAWPTIAAFANDLGENHATVYSWRWRDHLPAEKFQATISAASERGIVGITPALLTRLAAEKPARDAAREAARAEAHAAKVRALM